MKLYDIPNESKVYEECSDKSTFFTFHHIDGMYSLCTTENGATVHLKAFTEMEKHKDGYKIAN